MADHGPVRADRAKLECKHTLLKKGLSAGGGSGVPEMVRRALGGAAAVGGGPVGGHVINLSNSLDELSLSSCASNLDNIQPPTLMEEMDNSILSIASIASEVSR